MSAYPEFPGFKPISLKDKGALQAALWIYQPETSELTFTNIYMWSSLTRAHWCIYKDWVLVTCRDRDGGLYGLPPIGPSPCLEAVSVFLEWLRDEKGQNSPRIERADHRLSEELEGTGMFHIEPTRDHFDYAYERDALARLAGRKLHAKKNHVNKFSKTHAFEYAPIDETHIKACLATEDKWCRDHHCCDDINLIGEWEAIRKVLTGYRDLEYAGGVILIDGTVEAFTLGEMLNEETAVVHIEKANADIPGLYAVINQQFCEHGWKMVRYINREQDLGDEGLRRAKLSYHPARMVEKYRITPAEA